MLFYFLQFSANDFLYYFLTSLNNEIKLII